MKLDLTNWTNEQKENCAVKVPRPLLGNSIFVKVVERILGPSQETPKGRLSSTDSMRVNLD